MKLPTKVTRLSYPELLSRCLKGKTQNPNESLHSRIWQVCPKAKHLSKTILDFAVAQASINYNTGYVSGYLGDSLGVGLPKHMYNLLKAKDKSREKVRSVHPGERKKRKIVADPGYSAGTF